MSFFHKHRIDNPHDDRDHRRVGIFQHLTSTIPLTIDQHRITDSSLRVIGTQPLNYGGEMVSVLRSKTKASLLRKW